MTKPSDKKDEARDELLRALSDPDITEGPLQKLLERFSELIPVTDVINRVQWNSVVSKLVLPSGKEVDLAYITKNTAAWRIVLIELERPSKQLFIDTPYVDFHSATRGAIAQINIWKDDVANDIAGVRSRLYPLMHMGGHWDTNPIEVCYVLVIGRTPSGRLSKAQAGVVHRLYKEQQIRLLTWDSVLRMRETGRSGRLNVLVQKDGRASFKFGQAFTDLFAKFHPEMIDLPTDQEAWFREEGYDIDRWRKGDLLAVNWKSPMDEAEASIEDAIATIGEDPGGDGSDPV